MQKIFSGHNTIKLKISNVNMARKYPNIYRLNHKLLNYKISQRSLKRKLKISLPNKSENTICNFVGCSKSSAKREIYSITCTY